MKKVRTSIEV